MIWIKVPTTIVRCVLILMMAAVFAACATRPAESPAYRGTTPSEAVAINDDAASALIADQIGYKDHVSILALSGGGTDGAYGVGVLNGWTKSGTRPQFDIVTGVSTGALIAVGAFLGPQFDGMLKQFYLTQMESDVFKPRGFTGFFSDSLYDNAPLKRQIESFVTQDVLDQVAAEHAKGRRLYVATTNLDSSELIVWDMGLLASGGAEGRADRLELFQKVLRASSAIPVFFQPVYIKPKRGVQLRQAHVDGAIKAPVLLNEFLFHVKARRRDLYVIVNGSLAEEDAFRPVEPNIRDIAAKSVSGLTRELLQQTVYHGYVRAQNSGTGFFLTAIPDGIVPLESALDFNQSQLKLLYETGERAAQRADFWWRSPPTLKEFDRVPAR